MVQPCYKCGQLVEEGRPFCPHCVAPQIRVVVAEPAPIAVPATPPDTLQPSLPASETVPVLAVPMTWSQAVKPAALAAVIGAILMALGLWPLVAMLIMGFLATVFYRQSRPVAVMKTVIGMQLGALSGLFCAGVMSLFTALGAMIPEVRARLQQQSQEYFQKLAAAQPDNPSIGAVVNQLKTPEGFLALMIAGVVLLLALSIVLGAAGGALGAALLKRREKS